MRYLPIVVGMGKNRYPPLTPQEVVATVKGLNFSLDRQKGSHAQYERSASQTDPQRRVVAVDMAVTEFDFKLIQSMIRQSGESRERFYGATRRTAKKAGSIQWANE